MFLPACLAKAKQGCSALLQCYFSGATVLCANWNPPSHARLKLNLLCGDVMKEMGVLEKIDPLASEQRLWARSRRLRTAHTYSTLVCA